MAAICCQEKPLQGENGIQASIQTFLVCAEQENLQRFELLEWINFDSVTLLVIKQMDFQKHSVFCSLLRLCSKWLVPEEMKNNTEHYYLKAKLFTSIGLVCFVVFDNCLILFTTSFCKTENVKFFKTRNFNIIHTLPVYR